MRPIAVLGTGPAGLMSAYAVALTGKPLAVFGLGQKSRIGGAQFLHKPLPELNLPEPDFTVKFEVAGEASVYQQKVYGATPVPFVSFNGVQDGQEQPAWSLEKTYDWLWEQFGARANAEMIDAEWLKREGDSFRAIISTIPAPVLCDDASHRFTMAEVDIAEMSMLEGRADNVVRYDGTHERSWYRTSLINGIPGTEWGTHIAAQNPFKTVRVKKPIATTCDCHPEVIRAGRFGTWTKGVLTHDAFFHALKELNERDIISIGPKSAERAAEERGYL